MSNSVNFDLSRGVDVMRGSVVVAHFDGADALDRAWEYSRTISRAYVRFWGVKKED